MFGKLLKNEIRHSARYNLVIYCVALAACLLMVLSLFTESTGFGLLGCLTLYIIGIATVMVTLVSVIKNFYDSLFSKQGYLTLSLPVKGSSLLLSKVLVSFLSIIVGFSIMAVTWLLILFYVKKQSGTDIEMIKGLIGDFGILEFLPTGSVIAEVAFVLAILGVSKMLTYVGYIYFTVTVANTKQFQSHPKLFGLLTLFAIMIVSSKIENLLTSNLPLTFFVTAKDAFFSFEPMGSVPGALMSYGVGGTIFSALFALALLFATGYIIENKVNIK